MQKTLYIPIDTTLNFEYECPLLIKKYDTLTLKFAVFDKGLLKSLSGQTLSLILRKADGTNIEKTITNININIGTITLDKQATSCSGLVEGELQIVDSSGQVTTNTFTYNVNNALATDIQIKSADDINTLQDMRALIATYKEEITALGDSVQATEALINIENYISNNLTELTNKNATANANIATLQTENNIADVNIQALKNENDNADDKLDKFRLYDTTNLIQQVQNNTASLSKNANDFETKKLVVENSTTSAEGTCHFANWAGQTNYGSEPIGFALHHYTNGILAQFDNVGQGNDILILKNAYNPNRRTDKGNDYIGDGNFLTCLKANVTDASTQTVGVSKKIFVMDSSGNMTWVDKPDTVILATNKPDDNKSAFQFVSYNKHVNLFQIMNAYSGYELTIKHNTNNECVFESGNYATGGVRITSVLGNTVIEAQQGQVTIETHNKLDRINLHGVPYVWDGVAYNRVATLKSGASAGRPTSNLYAGLFYFDTSLGSNGKPIWYNGTNWIDATGTIV